MRRKLSIFEKCAFGLLGIALLACGTTSAAFTFSWFTHGNVIGEPDVGGATLGAYFASGHGTEDDPYIITVPRHLYNLAWLQYIGSFNKIENGAYNQTYFRVDRDLDMSSYTLPPIGTTENPFIGSFDGNGHTISNLHTSNALSDMTKKPSAITSYENVNVIGFFGVVGDCNGVLTESAYDSSITSVSNFTLQGVTVKDALSTTLIGIAAGYVNGSIEDVNIANSTLTVPDSGAAAYDTNITTNLSNFTSIGYATNDYLNSLNRISTDTATAEPVHSSGTSGGGEAAGWGGSIDMSSLYTRVKTTYNASTWTDFGNRTTTKNVYEDGTVDESTSMDTTYKFKTKTPDKTGSYSFSALEANSTEGTGNYYFYLYGKEKWNDKVTTQKYKTATTTVTGTVITDGTNYMVDNNGTLGLSKNLSDATFWTIGTGNQFTIKSNVSNKYLYASYSFLSGASLSLNTSSVNWQRNGNYLYWKRSNSSYYLYVKNSAWALATSTSNTRAYSESKTFEKEETVKDGSATTETVAGMETYDTYMPLNVDSSTREPVKNNTGYIVGGTDYRSSNYPYKSGDIRVSRYQMSNIQNALNTTSFSDSKLEVVTRTADSNGFVRISDSYNASNTSVSSTLSSAVGTKKSISDIGLTKYESSRKSLSEVMSGATYVYGMHFMDATISASKKVKLNYAMLNGAEYDDGLYEMPENCIDFNLVEKGKINFFAGTYFSGNTSFFSLHEISRDGETLSGTKEIVQIYGSNVFREGYVYKYADGSYSKAFRIVKGEKEYLTYSGNYPDNYSLVFDMDWCKTPSTWVDKAMYYYEIPVNAGEYALGSVPNTNGAYLIYLDIGANAQEVNRTEITSKMTVTSDTFVYPKGVAFSDPNGTETIEASDSADLALTASFSGSIMVSRSGDVISYESASSGVNAVYKGEDVTLNHGSTAVTEITPSSSTTEESSILTYLDYNPVTDETTRTEYVINPDGSQTVTVYYEDGSQTEGEWGETEIDTSEVVKDFSYRYFYVDGTTITCKLETTYSPDYDDSGKTYYSVTGYKLTVTADKDVKINVVFAKDGYEIYVNDSLVGTIPTDVTVSATA